MLLSTLVTLFLCGDVMSGRGIDQVLAHPSDPEIFEPYVCDARDYVALAERHSGPVPSPVLPAYVWGDALAELDRVEPDLRLINLETAITTSDTPWPGKGIHYRMHPGNIGVLTAAQVDCCVVANNHVLDWGHAGLAETTATLRAARIQSVGAGSSREEARRAAVFPVAGGRVIVIAAGTESSGIPRGWAAGENDPGVHLLSELTLESACRLAQRIREVERPGDIVVVSIHWGSNWGYHVPHAHRRFAHMLIDEAGADIVHGHSSHHPRGVEVYNDRLILYGAGDLINDYEGIGGHEQFRGDLGLLYFPQIDPDTGKLVGLQIAPLQMHRFSLRRASGEDAAWLCDMLNRESFGVEFVVTADDRLEMK